MTSIADALSEATQRLRSAEIENARIEARMLLSHVTGETLARLFAHAEKELASEDHAAFQNLAARRAGGEPAAHITGIREFWSLPFKVTPATLIPRPDTETLIEMVLAEISATHPPTAVLDIGTGTGCILLSILNELPEARGTGTDVSADALAVAGENGRALGLDGRASWTQGSWCAGAAGPFDLIVSNPPYIPADDVAGLSPEVRDFEPRIALDGGGDGMAAYRAIFEDALPRLSADGVLALEVGIGQADDVDAMGQAHGLGTARRRRDLAGIERALAFRKKGVGIPRSRG